MVFSDDRVVAFMTLGAVTPGHVLVVPRCTRSAWKTSTRTPALTSGGSDIASGGRCGSRICGARA